MHGRTSLVPDDLSGFLAARVSRLKDEGATSYDDSIPGRIKLRFGGPQQGKRE
jgi:hypothetical protein